MALEENTSEKIYGNASIQISELVGRTFNNPLGEYPFERFARIFEASSTKRVLDIGSGRGRAAILVARRFGLEVVAIEPSEEMAHFATDLVSREHLSNQVKILNSDFLSAELGAEPFQVVISFDVLSYFPDKNLFFEKVAQMLPKSCVVLFSDYFCSDPREARVRTIAQAWGITVPGDLNFYPEMLSRWGFRVDHFENTTPTYLAHWSEIKSRCVEKRRDLIASTSLGAVERYFASVDSIIEAVKTGKFGHLFCVSTRI